MTGLLAWARPPARCSQCRGRVQVPQTAPRGDQLAWWCDACASRPTRHAADVPRLHASVQAYLQRHLGVDLTAWLAPHRVHLVQAQYWPGEAGRVQLGQARTHVRVFDAAAGGRRELVDAEVLLLQGLGFLEAAKVLAHEAFHVYSALRGLDLTPQQEEGTANLWAYLLLAVHPGSSVVEQMRLRMLRDPDAIYGDGFRQARLGYKQAQGFADYLQRLRTPGLASA